MTTSPELAALDTNVLVYALYADAEHHGAARHLVEQARTPNAGLCFTPQVLAELYAVVTNPRRVTEAKSPEAILHVITTLIASPVSRSYPFHLTWSAGGRLFFANTPSLAVTFSMLSLLPPCSDTASRSSTHSIAQTLSTSQVLRS
jgi:hypothetical protein